MLTLSLEQNRFGSADFSRKKFEGNFWTEIS